VRGGNWLVITRFDTLGVVAPFFGGVGLDLGVAWTPGVGRHGMGPAARFGLGGFVFSEGTDPASYLATGMRVSLEGGFSSCRHVPGTLPWVCLLVYGGLLEHVVFVDTPCHEGACDDVLLGPSLRAEVLFLF
jgi:hypothetical protein